MSAPGKASRLRLFCFPHIGGAAQSYKRWPALLPKEVDVLPVQYPGRWERRDEPPCRTIASLAEGAASGIDALLDAPFAFFGHSMGTLVAFELARELARRGRPAPAHLFVSGLGAPQTFAWTGPPWRELEGLPDREFMKFYVDSVAAGVMKGVALDDEMIALLAPPLRADVEAFANYLYRPGPALACPISAYGGGSDPTATSEQLSRWKEQSSSSFSLRMFPGDHFFINDTSPTGFLTAFGDTVSGLATDFGG